MKPLIFVSHIHEHRNLAAALKREISNLLLNGVDFFVSSDRVSIVGGDRWLDQIETALNNAAIVLVICSKDAVSRPWVNFEAGGAWMAKKRVVPVCCGGLSPADLPQPLASRQAYSLSASEDLKDLVALIAREAGLSSPEFQLSELVTVFAQALVAPAEDTDARRTVEDLPLFPKTIRLKLKRTDHEFFDGVYEHDARDDARQRVREEEEEIKSGLRAFLAMRFGPKAVSMNYSGVKFPAGSIRTDSREELLPSGSESATWTEITIEIDSGELALLHEIRNHEVMRHAKVKVVSFLYEGRLNLEELAEDLYNRKVQVKRFGENDLVLGKDEQLRSEVIVKSSTGAVEISLEEYEFKELDLRDTLGPVFTYLRLADHITPLTERSAS